MQRETLPKFQDAQVSMLLLYKIVSLNTVKSKNLPFQLTLQFL